MSQSVIYVELNNWPNDVENLSLDNQRCNILKPFKIKIWVNPKRFSLGTNQVNKTIGRELKDEYEPHQDSVSYRSTLIADQIYKKM